jgi:hypothetical protein
VRNYHAKKPYDPEYWPSTTTVYNPDKDRVRIGLATEVCAERCVHHVYYSGGKRCQPTLTLPHDWADALGLDLKKLEKEKDERSSSRDS